MLTVLIIAAVGKLAPVLALWAADQRGRTAAA